MNQIVKSSKSRKYLIITSVVLAVLLIYLIGVMVYRNEYMPVYVFPEPDANMENLISRLEMRSVKYKVELNASGHSTVSIKRDNMYKFDQVVWDLATNSFANNK